MTPQQLNEIKGRTSFQLSYADAGAFIKLSRDDYTLLLQCAEGAVEAPSSTFSLTDYILRQEEWSARTFGHSPRTRGTTAHIRKELLEIESAPHDLEEWIDVVILALDGAWRAGYTPQEIVAALQAKQDKNFLRVYPKPLSDDDPSEHVRD